MIYDLFKFIIVALIIIFLAFFCTRQRESFMSEHPTAKQATFRYILGKSKQVLDKLGIPFFLSSGTCLGYAREKDFIEHDYDIDIGIMEKDYNPRLIDELQKAGLILYRVLGSFNSGMELSFELPASPLDRRAKIDIFVHKNVASKICWFSYYSAAGKKLKYCVSGFSLKEVDFLGFKVRVPEPLTKYLEEHYGKDWRIPKSNGALGEYHFASSPLSLMD